MKRERLCLECDAPLGRGIKYCSRKCYYVSRRGVNWKGDEATPEAGRVRARKRYTEPCCETCGASDADRHHINRDPLDNRPENIAFLCRRHHTELHHREDAGQRGAGNSQAKLNEANVRIIKAALVEGTSSASLAARFGVDPSAIAHIKRGFTWGHVHA